MSVWRDVQAGRNARGKLAACATAIGADETAVRVKGETTVVGVVADAATGEALGLYVLASSAIRTDSWI